MATPFKKERSDREDRHNFRIAVAPAYQERAIVCRCRLGGYTEKSIWLAWRVCTPPCLHPVVGTHGVPPLGCDSPAVSSAIIAFKNSHPSGCGSTSIESAACVVGFRGVGFVKRYESVAYVDWNLKENLSVVQDGIIFALIRETPNYFLNLHTVCATFVRLADDYSVCRISSIKMSSRPSNVGSIQRFNGLHPTQQH